jgi:hypothetical protein
MLSVGAYWRSQSSSGHHFNQEPWTKYLICKEF